MSLWHAGDIIATAYWHFLLPYDRRYLKNEVLYLLFTTVIHQEFFIMICFLFLLFAINSSSLFAAGIVAESSTMPWRAPKCDTHPTKRLLIATDDDDELKSLVDMMQSSTK